MMKSAFRRASTDMLRILLRTSDSPEIRGKAADELAQRGEKLKKCPYCGGLLSGLFYKPVDEGIVYGMEKYVFCPDCGCTEKVMKNED